MRQRYLSMGCEQSETGTFTLKCNLSHTIRSLIAFATASLPLLTFSLT
jgi:hypothetical protein